LTLFSTCAPRPGRRTEFLEATIEELFARPGGSVISIGKGWTEFKPPTPPPGVFDSAAFPQMDDVLSCSASEVFFSCPFCPFCDPGEPRYVVVPRKQPHHWEPESPAAELQATASADCDSACTIEGHPTGTCEVCEMLASAVKEGKSISGHIYQAPKLEAPRPSPSKTALKVTFVTDASVIPEHAKPIAPVESTQRKSIMKASPPNHAAKVASEPAGIRDANSIASKSAECSFPVLHLL
jgi:hypothetical protein